MADVATEAGLSSGAIYSYVQSKEALFHLVFVQAFGRLEDPAPALPLAAPPLADTLKLIADGLRRRLQPRCCARHWPMPRR